MIRAPHAARERQMRGQCPRVGRHQAAGTAGRGLRCPGQALASARPGAPTCCAGGRRRRPATDRRLSCGFRA